MLQTLLLYHRSVNLSFLFPNLYTWHEPSHHPVINRQYPSPAMAQAAAVAGLENTHGIIGKFKLEGTSGGL